LRPKKTEIDLLEIASAFRRSIEGPDIHLARTTGAAVVGVDINTHAIAAARQHARRAGLVGLATFAQADAARALPFEDGSFDAVVCIDAINHLPDRPRVLRDWQRLLRPGGRILFSDPAVVTGVGSSDELALCASSATSCSRPTART
jgi:ubiquinone/menaquinone biosynthesis C-methylase UbiE